jgi:DNA-directed RNA polymerase subunit N (RpoN/RPB10)
MDSLDLVGTCPPIRCFSCQKVLGNKYRYYQEEVRKYKLARNMEANEIIYLTKQFIDKTPEGEVMDKLGLTRYCCRRHILTHVDIE